MQYYCPKCQCTVSAIASKHTKTVFGKAVILEGDVTTCGAKFISLQKILHFWVMGLLDQGSIQTMMLFRYNA